MDKIIAVNIEKCMGCHTCEISCAVAHSKSGNLIEALYEDDDTAIPRIFIEQIDDKTMPIQCRHCEDAPCITVCPSKAISRVNDASPVTINNEKCIGCHACIIACPFGVIKKGKDGKSLVKCDLCTKRLQEGGIPACVEGCPTKAIRYVSIKEITKDKREKYKVLVQRGEV